MKNEIISHDGIALKEGMRVAYAEYNGILKMGNIIGFIFGLARIKTDNGWEVVKGGARIYAK